MEANFNLAELLSRPFRLSAEESKEVADLAKRYPWSEPIQMLHEFDSAKKLDLKNRSSWASLVVQDKDWYFNQLLANKLKKQVVKIETEIIQHHSDVDKTEQDSAVTSDAKAEPTQTDTPIYDIEQALSADVEKAADELEKQILESAISATILLEADEAVEQEQKLSDSDKTDLPTDEAVSPEIAEGQQPDSEKMSFANWLSFLADDNDAKQALETTKQPDKSKAIDQKDLVDGFINGGNERLTPVAKDRQGSGTLQTKKKVEFFNPIKAASLSLADNDAFVTETLAEVYASQNNPEKAVKIYEILMEKYPEKKAFFAARISALKAQFNN